MMQLKDPQITILFSKEGVEIEVRDSVSRITVVRVQMTAEQWCHAASRVTSIDCTAEVGDLSLVGKKHENKEHVFSMPKCGYEARKQVAYAEAVKTCPDGWIPDSYFGSRDSFFSKDGKDYARCTIRRWVDAVDQSKDGE